MAVLFMLAAFAGAFACTLRSLGLGFVAVFAVGYFNGVIRANYLSAFTTFLELARFLAAESRVHLVGHAASEDLLKLPNVSFQCVPRPFGSHLLGGPLLARAGRRAAERLSREGYRIVVNGVNCDWPDANCSTASTPRIPPIRAADSSGGRRRASSTAAPAPPKRGRYRRRGS